MKPFLLRLLKNALPATLLAALFGYALAYGSSIYIQVNTPYRPQLEATSEGPSITQPLPGDDIGTTLKTRLPISMAGWTFVIILTFEVLLALRKGMTVEPTLVKVKPKNQQLGPMGMDPEVEALFTKLLAQQNHDGKRAEKVSELTTH